MTKQDFSFTKEEHIKSNKEISRIINYGIFLSGSNLSLKYLKEKETEPYLHKVAFVVPKKRFKSAVNRNRIKRLIREAYRLNKHILYNNEEKITYKMIFINKSSKVPSYNIIQDEVIFLLNEICKTKN